MNLLGWSYSNYKACGASCEHVALTSGSGESLSGSDSCADLVLIDDDAAACWTMHYD